jgi:hypothetical protein
MNADEARDRGLGAIRGLLLGLAVLLPVEAGVLLALWWGVIR